MSAAAAAPLSPDARATLRTLPRLQARWSSDAHITHAELCAVRELMEARCLVATPHAYVWELTPTGALALFALLSATAEAEGETVQALDVYALLRNPADEARAMREVLAERANAEAKGARRSGAPRLSADAPAAVVLQWLRWNDPNADLDTMSEDDAWTLLGLVLEGTC